MPDQLRLRPFRNKGGVIRMMQRLFGTASRDVEALDPITVAAFLTKADRFYGAFDEVIVYDGSGRFNWAWYSAPANALIRNPGGAGSQTHERFWHPGQDILPPSDLAGAAEVFPKGILTGWYFLPSVIMFRFFDSAEVSDEGQVGSIYSFAVFLTASGVSESGDNSLLLGLDTVNGASHRQVYSEHTNSSDPNVLPLFPFPLMPGIRLLFDDITGVADTDLIRVTMTGLWIFTPRLMPATDEQNG